MHLWVSPFWIGDFDAFKRQSSAKVTDGGIVGGRDADGGRRQLLFRTACDTAVAVDSTTSLASDTGDKIECAHVCSGKRMPHEMNGIWMGDPETHK